MSKRLPAAVMVVVVSLLVIPVARQTARAAPAVGDVVPGRYIVVFRDSVTSVQSTARDLSVRNQVAVARVYERALKGFAASIPAAKLAQVRSDPRVRFVVPDRVVRIAGARIALAAPTARTPAASSTIGIRVGTQVVPTGINRIQADKSSQLSGDGTGSVGTAVAILDTGIDLTHPDLNVLGGVNCSTGSSFNDGHGHGTHVAGTVAGRDNTFGVVGVAPGAPLYAVRVLDNGGFGTTSTVVCGIDWVTANAASLGIKVANMSLSGAGSDDQNCGLTNGDPMHVAICNSVAAGIVYVVAAGNSAVNYRLSTPAAYTQVLTVTSMSDYDGKRGGLAAPTCSTDQDDTASSFSNYTGGFNSVHTIAGPGRCIYSTWMGGGYATASGTSMATPHVAGTVALCISSGACTGTPSQIMQKIRSDAATLPGTPSTYGFVGDPFRPIGTRYYGYLVFAKRY